MAQVPSSTGTRDGDTRSAPLKALSALGRTLGGVDTAERVVERTARTLEQLLRPDRLLIAVIDPESGVTTVAYASGESQTDPAHPLLQLARETGPRVITRDVPTTLAARGVTLDDPPGSWLGAPLVAGQLLGVVSLGSATPGRFVPADLEILTAVAGHAAIALENVRLISLLSSGKHEWEQTVDAIGQAFCVVDPTGAVRRANRAFSELADVPVTDIPGRPCMALVPPTWAESVGRVLADPAAAGTFELRARERIFTVSGLAVTGVAPGTVVLVFEDQTDKRRLQQQLIQSEKMSAIGQLIAGIAHDLNNPLASVIGFADYLVESADAAPPHLLEPLRAIRQEAERAAGIVKNLLTFARKQEGQRRPLAVATLLDTTYQLFKNQFMASKIDGEMDIVRDLPEVEGDPILLQQVLVNLVSNAIQAITVSQTGGRVVMRARHWLDGVAIEVEDDGPGVPTHLRERVFEPFFTTKPEGEGTGLGLSISQGIMKEHGGRLTYTARPTSGSIFRLELPAGTATAAPEAAPPSPLGQLRVLVIDDEPHIQHYMRATLEAWGHVVVLAEHGAAALDAIAADPPYDLIITDLRMPELGGREMFERLKRERPEAAERVVFSTGDTVRGDTLEFLESVGRPYLRKPFTLNELRAVMAAAAAR